MVKIGTFITNRLRESGRTASDIARDLGLTPTYIFRIIHGSNPSWHPKALKIREAIASQLNTAPDQLWSRPQKGKPKAT